MQMALTHIGGTWRLPSLHASLARMRGSAAEFSLFRIAPIAGAALLLSTRLLFQPGIFDFWGWRDITSALWSAFLKLFVAGTVMAVTLSMTTRFHPAGRSARVASFVGYLLAGSFLANLLLGLFTWVKWAFPPWTEIFSGTVYCCVLSGYLFLVDRAHSQALEQAASVRRLQIAKATLINQLSATRLQVLEAQIEPHFLFNTLANLKRVFRLDREKGDTALANLMVYLNAALPQMRRSAGTVAEEAELTRAYLALFSMRMGQRLKFAIQIDPCMMHIQMPTMMLLTLVENAIKHGLMPSENGGTVRIVARREQGVPVVEVIDDGVGFGMANTSGTGIGLSNIKARLAAMYGDTAKLLIEGVETGGVRAAIRLPKDAALSDSNLPSLNAEAL